MRDVLTGRGNPVGAQCQPGGRYWYPVVSGRVHRCPGSGPADAGSPHHEADQSGRHLSETVGRWWRAKTLSFQEFRPACRVRPSHQANGCPSIKEVSMQRAHRRRTGMALLAFVSSVTLFGAVTPATAAPSGPDAQALAKAADDLGVPATRLSIVQRSSAHLAMTHVDLTEYKVQAPDGREVAVSFDKATGALADSA